MPFLISRCCLGQGASASLGSRPEKGALSSSHRGTRTLEINQSISRPALRRISNFHHRVMDSMMGLTFSSHRFLSITPKQIDVDDDVLPFFGFASIPDAAFIAISLADPATECPTRWKVPLNDATNAKRRGDANRSTSEERARDIGRSGHFTRRERHFGRGLRGPLSVLQSACTMLLLTRATPGNLIFRSKRQIFGYRYLLLARNLHSLARHRSRLSPLRPRGKPKRGRARSFFSPHSFSCI